MNAGEFKRMRAEYLSRDEKGDDDELMLMKKIVRSLPVSETVIILLYAEHRSYRKLGAMLGISYGTVRKAVLKIRKKITEEYERLRKHPDA